MTLIVSTKRRSRRVQDQGYHQSKGHLKGQSQLQGQGQNITACYICVLEFLVLHVQDIQKYGNKHEFLHLHLLSLS